MAEGTRCTTIQPLIPLLLLVLLALSIGAVVGLRRARRRRAEERLVAEATPRVTARLAGLQGGVGLEPSVPFDAPAMPPAPAMAAAATADGFIAPVPAARPRSISSALVPWAGARAAASPAASVAVTHAYSVHPGEAAIMRRAPMALDGDLWRSQDMPGETGHPPADPRWRMWRDASAALVAFALVGLVLVGGDLLRIPTGPLPATPGLAAVVSQPSAAPTPTAVAVADPTDPQYPPVLTTPTPGPFVTPAPVTVPAVQPTPPLTADRTPAPTPRPTLRPTSKPTPTPPPLQAGFICSAPVTAGVEMTCQLPIGNGPGVKYQWSVGLDLSSLQGVSTQPVLHYTFPVADFTVLQLAYVQLIVTRGTNSAQSFAAFDVIPAVP